MKRSFLALVCLPAMGSLPVHPATLPIFPTGTDVFGRAIALFGGHAVDMSAFPQSVAGFAEYLAAVGVRSISAADLTRPHLAGVAGRLGFHDFLPRKEWWPRGAALALLTERLDRAAVGHVSIRNWWRPAAYNQDPAVGGARNGDHPTANAFDLDYSSPLARAKAERALRSLEAQAPWLNLSLGLGAKTTHVGIGSPRGHREWHYPGWTPAG